jgi:hypothetical protein
LIFSLRVSRIAKSWLGRSVVLCSRVRHAGGLDLVEKRFRQKNAYLLLFLCLVR